MEKIYKKLEEILFQNKQINFKINKLLMTTQELQAQLDAMTTKVGAIDAAVKVLVAEVGASTDVPQNVVDAVKNLSDAIGTTATDAGA